MSIMIQIYDKWSIRWNLEMYDPEWRYSMDKEHSD